MPCDELRSVTPWQTRALCAERHERELRVDLERALARYHDILDECNRLRKELGKVKR